MPCLLIFLLAYFAVTSSNTQQLLQVYGWGSFPGSDRKVGGPSPSKACLRFSLMHPQLQFCNDSFVTDSVHLLGCSPGQNSIPY